MSLVVHSVRRVVKCVRGLARAPLVIERVVHLIAETQLVAVVNVPVDTCHKAPRLSFNVSLIIRIGVACPAIVFVEYLLCLCLSEEVVSHGTVLHILETWIVGAWIRLLAIFQRGEEEQFVLEYRTTESETVSLVSFVGQLAVSALKWAVFAVEVLVSVICVGRTLEHVST